MILTVAEQVLQPVQVAAGVIQIATCQRDLHNQRQALQLLLRLQRREHLHALTRGGLRLVEPRPRPQKLGADAE